MRYARMSFWNYGSLDPTSNSTSGVYYKEDANTGWSHCSNGTCSAPYITHNFPGYKSDGTTIPRQYIKLTDIASAINTGFQSSYIVHAALGDFKYTENGVETVMKGASQTFQRDQATIAMYFVDFIKPAVSYVYATKAGTYTYTVANARKMITIPNNGSFTPTYYSIAGTDGKNNPTVGIYYATKQVNSNLTLSESGSSSIGGLGCNVNNSSHSCTVDIDYNFLSAADASTDQIKIWTKTTQTFIRGASGRILKDTTVLSKDTLIVSLTHPFVVKDVYDLTSGAPKAVGTFKVSPASGSSLPSGDKYSSYNEYGRLGYKVTLTATPNSGYHFVGWWSNSAQYVSFDPTTTVYFYQDTTLTPLFEENADAISLSFSSSSSVTSCTYNYGKTNMECPLNASVTSNTLTKFLVYSRPWDTSNNSWGAWKQHGAYTFSSIKANPNSKFAFGKIFEDNNVVKIQYNANNSVKLFDTNYPTTTKTQVKIVLGSGTGTSFNAVKESDPVTVLWKLPATFYKNDGTTISSSYYAYNSSATLPTKARAGIPSDGSGIVYSYYWQDTENSTNKLLEDDKTVTVTKPISYKAVLITKYNVTFYDYDGTVLKPTQTYVAGTASANVAKPNNPTRKGGYNFKGWSTSATSTSNLVTDFTVNEPASYYAIYYINVDFISETGFTTATQSLAKITIEPKTSVASYKPTPNAKDGYTFVGWYKEGDETQTVVTDFIVTEPTNFVAKFVKTPVISATSEGLVGYGHAIDVKFNTGNDCVTMEYNGSSPLVTQFENGTEYTANVIVHANTTEECAENELVKEIVEANKYSNVTISINIDGEKLNANVNNNDLVKTELTEEDYKNGNFVLGVKIQYTFTAATRYLVDFMSESGEARYPISSHYYVLDANLIEPTEAELEGVVIPEDDAEWHYFFDNKWTYTPAGALPNLTKENFSTTLVTKEVAYYPIIEKEKRKYTVTFSMDGEKYVDDKTVEYGESVTLPDPKPTKNGYLFMGWNTEDGSTIDFYEDQEITGPTTLYAVFTEIPEIKFAATGLEEGKDYITVTSPNACFTIGDDAAVAGVNSQKPMVAGKEYTWTATVSINNCTSTDLDFVMSIAYARSAINKNNLSDKVPVMVNDYVGYEDLMNVQPVAEGEVPTFTLTFKFKALAVEMYTITFFQADGTTKIGEPAKLKAGEQIVAPAENLVTVPTEEGYNYVFKGWNPELKDDAVVTGEASYTAKFEKVASSTNSSSSSAKSSSSTAKSSSSTAKSSSSSVKSSSSSAKSSSSSVKSSSSSAKSSSSSVKSSSSKKTEAIVAGFEVPKFQATVSGRNLTVFGATVGAKLAIFDLQGSVISIGHVDAANFSVTLPHSGMYAVRIGNQIQKVNAR